MASIVLLSACGDWTHRSTTDATVTAAGSHAARTASRGVESSKPRVAPCPPFVLTRLIDRKTGERVTLFYRWCHGAEQYIDLANSSIVEVVAP